MLILQSTKIISNYFDKTFRPERLGESLYSKTSQPWNTAQRILVAAALNAVLVAQIIDAFKMK